MVKVNDIWSLFNESSNYKQQINEDIARWLSIYDGEPYGNEVDGRSKMVWKLIKKQTRTLSSNITKQFIGSDSIVKIIPSTKNDVIKAKIDEKLLNFFWNFEIDKVKVVKRISLIASKEGTCFVKVGWEKRTRKEYVGDVGSVNLEMLKQSMPNYDFIVENDKVYKTEVIKNKPKLDILANEDVYTDPLAYTVQESRFLFIRKEVTIEDLKSNPLISDEKVEGWIKKLREAQSVEPSEDLHDRNLEYLLVEDTKEDKLPIEDKVTLYEFWYREDGKIKIKYLTFDGSIPYVFAEKDFEFNFYPFVAFNLEIDEFSIWGKGLPDLIDDEQKFMTSIVRGVIDNMAISNFGTKFIKKGALDSVNFNRLMNGEPVVEINTTSSLKDVMVDGNFNELPNAVYTMLQIIEQQSEGLTGISRTMQGIDSDLVKSPASNYSAMLTQSQIRLMDFISSFQQGFKEIFYIWLKYAMKYLSDDEIYERTGISIPDAKFKKIQELKMKYNIEKLPLDVREQAMQLIYKEVFDIFNKEDVKYDIRFRVGGDGLSQIRINQINMLMQQLIPAMQSGTLPPVIMNKLLAKLADLMEFPEIADFIEEYQPQPDPMQQQMAQLEMMEKQAKAKKEMALAENAIARSQSLMNKDKVNVAKAQTEMADKVSTAKLKESQAIKNQAEAQKILKEIKDGEKEKDRGSKRVNAKSNEK